MRRSNTESVAAVLRQFLQQQGLEQPFLEHKLLQAWPELMGPLVKKYTGRMEIKNVVLFVQISSAALRQELFIARRQLVEKLNSAVGADVITDIRLLG
ncbi:MAG: DUF721 domain-containing protein [Paludibacteraceae bacterium]|nr:DUF721 domain-containing protein [Paludibacteraceae bacterium]